ncbi:MAG: DUF3842 family protein [Thermodesulfovibrionales bacterium]|nr:DUF3842 family protein [Thermodesulfovibrionales bacterium]
MKKIGVIDGQGGGIGSLIIKRLREELGETIEIVALGTNSTATSSMMKARANKGATGENAILFNVSKLDIIIGPLSIILSNGFLGELTPAIATAIASSPAKKFLLPLNQENVEVVAVAKEPLPHLIDHLIMRIKEERYV